MPGAEVVMWSEDLPRQDAEIAVVWGPPAGLFERERKLRVVFNLGAGVDALFRLPTLPAELPIVRLEDAGMAVQMAEYAAHALVRASRQFDQYEALQREGRWQPLPELDRSLWPVGVLGMGVMGARVASSLAALDYPVAGWSRSGKCPDGIQAFGGRDALDAFLGRTRVLINTLPLTDDTHDLLCRETLSKLMPGAYLINMGRGAHLVEEDLLALLDSGQVAGATLDVFRTEPLPLGHPFWTHPRVTVTPHVAAMSLRRETLAQVAAKIQAFIRGEPLSGLVSRERGY
ncbi:putative glyoxylate/hydroxypyruvate reductase A [Bordetella holmesii CDC-H635-BH]|uniref:Putative glyoxylate/hydroxypyruvate reductase A n=1 Tax=Bordetella holmesii CDC-H585-BH TaxID=1331206 RepID=A0A158M429_9BORD|nr:NAD binding domain of 6-phosphogluconate dehydrogenase family protein [Bordetella holmesii 70147]KAK82591.1 putative glyoxylate/hydroxypyruvate reductase A [Bordetella holmesii CDC-H572-BH]KAK83219.1 putative glyoxylate/hydroxypyruvate reductase A [Bordetella holmesii CDC-H809-BH]KAK85373.1 putative glyoxylate/hydroxypyruvate reductase A [Bordetella holmesii H620]KAK90962.1 putative glyoxylate/hydroxypyruvate reductase A [Bordetella holmesii CDC-H635-BH]KAK95356.1 putative glyoxylate/hydrox